MATPKKNTTTKVDQNALPVSLKPSNANEFPMVYADNIWHIAASGSAMADEMGNTGQFDQQTVNEQLATLIASALADIVLFKKTDGTAGSIKKIVDDAIAAVIAEAPAAFDTLKEISDWIASHAQDASAMNTAIQGKVDKVTGKGLSENDYTDTEKSKLAAIESGAEVNVIDGVTINGNAATVANKKIALAIPQQYVFICKNYSGSTTTTITAATHGCGNMPLVVCYMDNKTVGVDVSINSSGDVTVGWNTSTSVSAATPLTICILGVSVTAVEEEQPIPIVPDASDFPYLTFTKTGNGVCSVKANTEETFEETSVDIPAAVMLNGEELAVTSIEDYAFEGCSLTSVTIPNSVTSIGEGAFEYCDSLESVTISNSVTSIEDYAFDNCSNLTSVTIPNSVTSIGQGAFGNCSSLASVTISNSVTSIGDYAFQSCGLISVTIPNSVTSIGDYAFEGCSSLTSVTIPNSVTSIGERAFEHCDSLESVTIPNSVTSIGSSAFANCTNLATVSIGSGVDSIGDSMFYGCSSLTSVTIPNSITSIGSEAFANCTDLATLTIGSGVDSIGNSAFEGCSGLINVSIDCDIPNNLFESYDDAYPNLTTVVIGNNVTSIGDYAFYGCSNIVTLTIGNSVESIGVSAFQACNSITSLTIPNSVTSIGQAAFWECDLTTLTIGNSVETIGGSVFDCTNLTSVIIPNSVISIGEDGFEFADSCTIYCVAASQPAGWDSNWTDCQNVVWGYTPNNNGNEQEPNGGNEEPAVENCPECGQPMQNGECTNTDCSNSPYYVEPAMEEPCPICGVPMIGGECGNSDCPNSPSYIEPQEPNIEQEP